MVRVIFVLLGGAILYGAWWLYRRNERIKATWQVMTAEVMQMVRVEREKGPDRWKAVYRYQVNGREFFGQCDGSAKSSMGASSDCAPGALRGTTVSIGSFGKRDVGGVVEILVDPANLGTSHARDELSLVGPVFLAGFGGLFVLIALFAPDNPH